MKENVSSKVFAMALCAFLLVPGPVLADGNSSNDDWQFSAAAYLWGAGIGGHSANGSEVDISFNNLFNNLNAAFMGSFEARKDKWLVITDLIYLNVSADDTRKVTVPLPPQSVDIIAHADLDLAGLVFQLAGGYNLLSERALKMDLLVGARFLKLDSDISVDLSALGQNRQFTGSESGSVWDGFIGVKGMYAFNSRWSLPYYIDIGTGQSDLTWQAMAGVAYHAAKWVDIALGYRYMEWEVGGNFVDDINFSGPTLGAVFRW